MRGLAAIVCLGFCFSAHAALVDNGSFTTDTDSGLDWLDLTETMQTPMLYAEANNPGWRLATNAEVESLFAVAFDGYYDTSPSGFSDSLDGAYADQISDVIAFQSLFGFYNGQTFTQSIGLYLDEDNLVRVMGSRFFNQGNTVVWGPESIEQYPDAYSTGGMLGIGSFLVRTSVVPVPAAVWLFASALAGLGWAGRFRRSPG